MDSDAAKIFKATYSGVPVYEMICKGVAVMRRRSDSYLNATQILKVADFDKPQRTRILEREIQKGEHEKVQGGYGKYQGTWVPFDRGIALAQQYHVEHLLKPIIDFAPSGESPPPAPKHVTAASGKPKKPKLEKPGSEEESDVVGSETNCSSASDSMSGSDSDSSDESSNVNGARKRRKVDHVTSALHAASAKYAELLIDYFVGSEAAPIPSFLLNPPADFDVNLLIDEEGHTALHWACAMGKIRVVKLLLQAGADIYRVNNQGQTALMRSVMFTNNHDLKTFPELLNLLQKTIFNIDKFDQTVFHHIASLGTSKQKQAAVKHYMEILLNKLADAPEELASMINVQDVEGDTALNIAARLGQKRLCKLLVDNGADPKIRNKHELTAEDHIFGRGVNSVNGQITSSQFSFFRPHLSETAAKTTSKILPTVNDMIESLATSYDKGINEMDSDLTQAKQMHENIKNEIIESKKTIESLIERAQMLPELESIVTGREKELRRKIDEIARFYIEEALNKDVKTVELEDDTMEKPTLKELQQQRQALTEEIVQFHIRGGNSTRSQEYRKLIALCCSVPLDAVDDMLGALITALESEDNSFLTM